MPENKILHKKVNIVREELIVKKVGDKTARTVTNVQKNINIMKKIFIK